MKTTSVLENVLNRYQDVDNTQFESISDDLRISEIPQFTPCFNECLNVPSIKNNYTYNEAPIPTNKTFCILNTDGFFMVKKESICDMKLIPSSMPIDLNNVEQQSFSPAPVDSFCGIFDRFKPFARMDKLESIPMMIDEDNENSRTQTLCSEVAQNEIGTYETPTKGPYAPPMKDAAFEDEKVGLCNDIASNFTEDEPMVNIVNPKIVVEEKAKQYIRLFRRSIKRQFDDIYKRKHYHWTDAACREKTAKFFMETLDITAITPELYKENECAFFMLMHPSTDRKQLKISKRNDTPWFEIDEFSYIYKLVFGQHPSKPNLKKFFNNKII